MKKHTLGKPETTSTNFPYVWQRSSKSVVTEDLLRSGLAQPMVLLGILTPHSPSCVFLFFSLRNMRKGGLYNAPTYEWMNISCRTNHIQRFFEIHCHIMFYVKYQHPKNSVCTASIFYCSDDCMIILTLRKQYITEQHMTEPSSFAVTTEQ